MTNDFKKRFKEAVAKTITRDGIDNLMDWLENDTDFFTSPASTRYHGSYEGGLVEHSLNVFNQLIFELDKNLQCRVYYIITNKEATCMTKLAVNASPQSVKVVLAGNIQFLEHLRRKYGKSVSIDEIIKKERGQLK